MKKLIDIPDNLLAKLKASAKKNDRSVVKEVIHALKVYLN
jgi:hypothetical protein